MAIEGLGDFNLAGGTALSLQIGHRTSYDLDFFATATISMEEVVSIVHDYRPFQEMHRTENIVVLDMEGIKVDFVNYRYPLIGNLRLEEEIRLLSLEDIAAMKIDAIKGRGRKRDFYDLYFLLKRFELGPMLELHRKKYQQDTRFLIMKSLIFFDDADHDAPVVLQEDDITWEEVKETIRYYVSKALP